MNFFEAQDRARRASRWLVVVYLLATALIVAGVTLVVAAALYTSSTVTIVTEPGAFLRQQAPVLVAAAVVTTLFIVGATLYRTVALSAGGGRVAADMGGTLVPADIEDPLRRRLRNVVEEMSIASGVPVPDIYVLEQESGINAFAAGYSPADAAVAVTRGALELLDRDELQGVIAHEFSHILNGDMRLNIRMMGVLFGIMALGLIGRVVLRGGHRTRYVSGRRGKGSGAIVIIGLGLVVLGAIGVFFARLIKAAVSRQREALADASAVQFTRQTRGIADALKKIGGYSGGSLITAVDPEEVSHMLFGAGSRLGGLFATHPPLAVRIRALDPSFDESRYPRVDRQTAERTREAAAAESPVAGFTAALAGGGAIPVPERLSDSVGRPDNEHVDYAARIRLTLPESLYAAAHSADFAWLLTLALLLDRSGRVSERQLALLEEQLGARRARIVRGYFRDLVQTGAEYRLPLLEIVFPALKQRPAAQVSYLLDLVRRLIEIDGERDLYEFCFYRTLSRNLDQATSPGRRERATRPRRKDVRLAAVTLIRVLAEHGHDDHARRERAFRAGLDAFGAWAADIAFDSDADTPIRALDEALDLLLVLNADGRAKLLDALSAVAAEDGRLAVPEAELLRAVCASLDCPLPPILVRSDAA